MQFWNHYFLSEFLYIYRDCHWQIRSPPPSSPAWSPSLLPPSPLTWRTVPRSSQATALLATPEATTSSRTRRYYLNLISDTDQQLLNYIYLLVQRGWWPTKQYLILVVEEDSTHSAEHKWLCRLATMTRWVYNSSSSSLIHCSTAASYVFWCHIMLLHIIWYFVSLICTTLPRNIHQTLRKEALEEYLAGGLKETSIVYQVHHSLEQQRRLTYKRWTSYRVEVQVEDISSLCGSWLSHHLVERSWAQFYKYCWKTQTSTL